MTRVYADMVSGAAHIFETADSTRKCNSPSGEERLVLPLSIEAFKPASISKHK
jgi:hypothetical protein